MKETRTARLVRLAFLGALAVTSTTCSSDGVDATPCNEDADCVGEARCRLGTCVVPSVSSCGDGTLDPGEACDDGNLTEGDGCSPLCTVEGGVLCDAGVGACEGCRLGTTVLDEGDVSPTNACLVCTAGALIPVDDGVRCAGPDACGTVGECDDGACVILAGCGGETPVCDVAGGGCVCDTTSCDDGLHCNGEEACADDGACEDGAPPTCMDETPICSEDAKGCVECAVDKDCTGENPFCRGARCVACADCPCPFGEADGGDGACVPVGTCSEGFSRLFVDADLDGVGAGTAGLTCHAPPFPAGRSPVGTDCDDGDATRATSAIVYPDVDGDGFTDDAVELCVGDALPDWARVVPAFVPRVSLRARNAINVNGGAGTESWQNLGEVADQDGQGSFCRPYGAGCRFIVLRRLNLAIPSNVVVTGLAVDLIRRASSDDVGVIFESHVMLAPDGVPAGENRADSSSSWPFEYAPRTYGGAGDTWGLLLTPELLNDIDFGIAVSVLPTSDGNAAAGRIDAVRVRVYTNEERVDCADDDATRYALRPLFTDQDSDNYTVPGSLDDDCVGETLPAGRIQHSFGDDCYDGNASANPEQTGYFSTHRGDGSFDYNCNGVNNKEGITQHGGCACDAAGTGVCEATSTSIIFPGANCGTTVGIPRCAGDCATCALGSESFTVRCR